MAGVIRYDMHVKNLIAELSKTGHVTHSEWRKKSVTFHHNGGVNLSHEAVLSIWRSRPTSAHFDIDKNGDPAQYVEVDEYAWAVGNTTGNEETISIELANSKGAPHWDVSDLTWKSGARLAGWLFVHVIKDRPNKHNVLLHHHWSATSCPGPFIDSIYDDILKVVQHWYEYFSKNENRQNQRLAEEAARKTTTKKTARPHQPRNLRQSDVDKIKDIQRALGLEPDGKWGDITDHAVLTFRKQHHNKF
jgi:hypothetical protein